MLLMILRNAWAKYDTNHWRCNIFHIEENEIILKYYYRVFKDIFE